MAEDHDKDRWKTFTEEVEIAGNKLVDEITKLISEGNIRRLRIRSENDDVVLEVPLTAGAVVGGVVVLTAPWLAILGALAGLLVKVRIEVVRDEGPGNDDGATS
jgi:phage terminase large subunit-like protein